MEKWKDHSGQFIFILFKDFFKKLILVGFFMILKQFPITNTHRAPPHARAQHVLRYHLPHWLGVWQRSLLHPVFPLFGHEHRPGAGAVLGVSVGHCHVCGPEYQGENGKRKIGYLLCV